MRLSFQVHSVKLFNVNTQQGKIMFKQYKRTIEIFYRNETTGGEWRYCYSTRAYKTCKEAAASVKHEFPNSDVKAWFKK